jgi:hypothetical protein
MMGDVDEEVGGDNDAEENAMDVLAAWWDRHCKNAGPGALAKGEWGFNCERPAITSAGTPWEVGDYRIREEQRELQGPKSKSRGTETVMSPEIKFTKWERSGIWPLKSGSLVCLHFGGLLSICSNSLRHFC